MIRERQHKPRFAHAMQLLRWLTATGVWLVIMGSSVAAHAQKVGRGLGNESLTNRPLILMAAIAGLALVPFLLIMVTSFVKIAVVLSIIRQAIGTQQIPPTQVITGIAIILTVYIMMPVGLTIYHNVQEEVIKGNMKLNLDNMSAGQLMDVWAESKEPVRGFLLKHAQLKDRDMFFKLAWRMREPRDRAALTDQDFAVVIPAFVISELKEAFQIGFILFVPFLVIDMIVANILMALGMQMLSPTTISLPFKILLFVMVDGWYLVTQGLVLGYQ